jgi:hypothetical protein
MLRNDRSEIDRQTLLLPIAITHGFGAVATSQFFRPGGLAFGQLAAGFGFGQGAAGGRGQIGERKIGRVHAGFLVRLALVI